MLIRMGGFWTILDDFGREIMANEMVDAGTKKTKGT
jgi:hypothetical protein